MPKDSKKPRAKRDTVAQTPVPEQAPITPTAPDPGTAGKRESVDYAAYWVTRDSSAGALSDRFEVWTQRPRRIEIETAHAIPDVRWGGDGHFGTWTRGEAMLQLRNGIPASDRESVIYGHPESEQQLS